MAEVTIKDIAKQLGISPATVSMALNDRAGVNAQTKEKVLKLVKELNYTGSTGSKKNTAAQGVISLLVYKRHGRVLADTQFFTDLMESVERASRSFQYTLTLTYCTGRENLAECITSALSVQPMGMLLLGTEMTEDDLSAFRKLALPIVIMDADLYGCDFDTVTIHNEDGVWRAMQYFHEQGHQDIGYLRSSYAIRNFEQRLQSYQAYRRQNCDEGAAEAEEKIFMVEPSLEGAQADVDELLTQGIDFPRALLADNDLIALGAMKAFVKKGIHIPEDISIIGFDDIPMAGFFEPPLTSILVSREELGAAAVQQLIWRCRNKKASARRFSIGTRLMKRDSVKKLKK